MTKSIHGYKNKDLYSMIGITKQGFYKRVRSAERREARQSAIINQAKKLRKTHSRMGCRKLYGEMKPCFIGRDKVEKLLLENGFRVPRKRSYHRTTYAGNRYYDNLISGIEVKDKNEVWVSDITYIPIAYKSNYYLTLILDVYTRKITGWSLSKTLITEDTVYPAFKRAINELSVKDRKGLVFHSDKGSQYGSDLMRDEYRRSGIKPSMGGKAWENAHAESLNGILKNEYINFGYRAVNFQQAKRLIKKWIYIYNNERPHGSIKNMKPVEYETYLEQLTVQDKPKITINY